MTNFKINVTSDTVCPWCYVGKKRLEHGIQLYQQQNPDSKDTFEVSWEPFQLNPHQPKGPASSHDKQQYYVSKFGEQRTKVMQQNLSQVGTDLGIKFKFGGRTGNSRDTHRLVQLAKTKGPKFENAVIDQLFAAYFENEKDITSYETLRAVAIKAGIADEEFNQWIVNSDGGGAAVDNGVKEAQRRGISGVPDYIIQDKYEISGAQDPSVFVRAFNAVKKTDKVAPEVRNGSVDSCAIDSKAC